MRDEKHLATQGPVFLSCANEKEIFSVTLIQSRLPVFTFVSEQIANYSKSIPMHRPRQLFSWYSFIKGLQVYNAKDWLQFPLSHMGITSFIINYSQL
jgi:hypothetical protein